MIDEIQLTEFKTQSESISKIAVAVSKAQAKMTNAKRTAENPFFKSKYADLSAVWDAVREPLAENELAVIQAPTEDDKGTALVTTLAHSSGEWFKSKLYIVPKARDPQSVGSAITYARRYALSAITGVATDDDDGERAGHSSQEAPKPYRKPTPPTSMVGDLNLISDIREKLAEMNDGNEDAMNAHLKILTTYKDKKTGEDKFVQLDGLERIGQKLPNWLENIHKKVVEAYNSSTAETESLKF